MQLTLPSPAARQWGYRVALALLALFVGLKLVDPAMLPLWADLAAAVLGAGVSGTATVALSQQRKGGTDQ